MCVLCSRLKEPDPFRIAELEMSVVILGDNQGCPGWCTLILRRHVEHLDELSVQEQAAVFAEVALVARSVRMCFPDAGEGGDPVRINYECLGNVAAHVHWHVIPRHAGDPSLRATVWGWSAEQLRGSMSPPQRAELAGRLRGLLHDASGEISR
jgi:diadenosine tetraphosphate (Ap4A) HIT family hydrolase